MAFDVDMLTSEQGDVLNVCAVQFGMQDNDYME